MGDFVHLHNHSHYSLQDAACTIDSLIGAAVKNNMHAVALTDHGVMYGIPEFYKKARKANIKPILGMEAYIVMDSSRKSRGEGSGLSSRKSSKNYNHLVLLAKNKTGYQNLMKLSTIGHLDGFYYKPRIDLEVLREHSEGLISTSACPAGPVSSHLISQDMDRARKNALLLKEIFEDDFYLEIQNHNLEIEKPILEGMPKLAEELGIKLVATNDIHYIEQDHAIAHNILLLLGDKTGNVDHTVLRYNTDQVYFKSIDQMKELFLNRKDAIENTLEIEEKINLDLDFEKFHYPQFPIPKDSPAGNLEQYFELLSREGLNRRFKKLTAEIEDRFNYEISTIVKMGYAGYFLIVQDFIDAAKTLGIPVGPGRGSAAGSLVAYALGITNVNPLDYNLLFERFLNPERKSMPDIDVDFSDDQRGQVIEYTKHKYGEDSVCQIITFNRLSSKAVLRDVARVLKIPIPVVNSITKWIPSKFGRVYSLDQALDEVSELKWVKESTDPKIEDLIKYSRILEGMNRNASKHAAGVVITPGPVSNYLPLAKAGSEGDIVTQYNMKELDDAGILKMDFLGLRTLSIMRDTVELVKKTRNIEIDIENISLKDEKTYKLFSKGQTTGVFQFESAPMREYLKKLKANSISDLAAMNALYRPGPMDFIDDFIARKHGRQRVEYLNPLLESILEETYGIIVYQEQVIQIANIIAGLTLAEADLLRRAMGKKDLKAMAEQKKKFIDGAIKNKIDRKTAEEIFHVIDKFANYGFNKSHAVAYSLVAYQTAYLKAHYLPEFMAANLTNEYENTDKISLLLDDCRKLKVKVLPPSVNDPSVKFNVRKGKIVFGMSAIKNVGVSAVEEIERNRSRMERDFTSIYDFCSNIDTRIVNKRALEGLVMAGAFDSVKGTRAQNYFAIEDALDFGSKAQASKEFHLNSLFGSNDKEIQITERSLPDVKAWTNKERLAKEREVLGFYLSDHPLRKFEVEYRSFATVRLGDPETFGKQEHVTACGVITDVRTKIDKSGKQMAFFKIDDFSGSCECIMFSKLYAEYKELLKEENTVLIKGRLESSGDAIKLHAEELLELEISGRKLSKKFAVILDENLHDESSVDSLKNIFIQNEGPLPVFVRIKSESGSRDFYVDHRISLNDKLIKEIKKMLGDDSFQYVSG